MSTWEMYVVCVSYVKDCNSQPDEWHRFDTKFDMIKCICTDKENIGNQIILQKYLRALWYDQAQHRWVTSELSSPLIPLPYYSIKHRTEFQTYKWKSEYICIKLLINKYPNSFLWQISQLLSGFISIYHDNNLLTIQIAFVIIVIAKILIFKHSWHCRVE